MTKTNEPKPKLADNTLLYHEISKKIHLEEWCPQRDYCSGTSAASDHYARIALEAIDKFQDRK